MNGKFLLLGLVSLLTSSVALQSKQSDKSDLKKFNPCVDLKNIKRPLFPTDDPEYVEDEDTWEKTLTDKGEAKKECQGRFKEGCMWLETYNKYECCMEQNWDQFVDVSNPTRFTYGDDENMKKKLKVCSKVEKEWYLK